MLLPLICIILSGTACFRNDEQAVKSAKEKNQQFKQQEGWVLILRAFYYSDIVFEYEQMRTYLTWQISNFYNKQKDDKFKTNPNFEISLRKYFSIGDFRLKHFQTFQIGQKCPKSEN